MLEFRWICSLFQVMGDYTRKEIVYFWLTNISACMYLVSFTISLPSLECWPAQQQRMCQKEPFSFICVFVMVPAPWWAYVVPNRHGTLQHLRSFCCFSFELICGEKSTVVICGNGMEQSYSYLSLYFITVRTSYSASKPNNTAVDVKNKEFYRKYRTSSQFPKNLRLFKSLSLLKVKVKFSPQYIQWINVDIVHIHVLLVVHLITEKCG